MGCVPTRKMKGACVTEKTEISSAEYAKLTSGEWSGSRAARTELLGGKRQ
jgi:hypothetical protein